MNRLIGTLIFVMGGIFLWGQVRVLRTEPLTVGELTQRQEHLFQQLDSLEGNADGDAFSETILKEIKNLDEQKGLLTKHK